MSWLPITARESVRQHGKSDWERATHIRIEYTARCGPRIARSDVLHLQVGITTGKAWIIAGNNLLHAVHRINSRTKLTVREVCNTNELPSKPEADYPRWEPPVVNVRLGHTPEACGQ